LRTALFEEAQRLLQADVSAIDVFNDASTVLVKPCVTGYTITHRDSCPGPTTMLALDAAPAWS
jgi:hypothetical protein